MISENSISELKEIISSEYQVELDLNEARKIGESLVNIYSAVLQQNDKANIRKYNSYFKDKNVE